jgi:hypothetical protein
MGPEVTAEACARGNVAYEGLEVEEVTGRGCGQGISFQSMSPVTDFLHIFFVLFIIIFFFCNIRV